MFDFIAITLCSLFLLAVWKVRLQDPLGNDHHQPSLLRRKDNAQAT